MSIAAKIQDLWAKVPSDKQGHIRLGLLLGLAFGNHTWIAIGVVVGAAVLKELADYLHNVIAKAHVHDVEVMDAVATIAGGAIGIGAVAAVDYLLSLV